MLFGFKINFKDYFFNISRRTRMVVLVMAGVVFLVLLCFAVWFRYFADTLIDYASSQTGVYIHFNISKFKAVDGWDGALKQVFSENGLTYFDLDLIDREVALLGQIGSEDLSWILLLKTNQAGKLEKVLLEKGVDFRFLSFNKIAVFPLKEFNLVKDRKNIVKSAVKRKFFGFDNLAVFVSPKAESLIDDSIFSTLFASFADSEGNFFLQGKLKRDCFLVFPPRIISPGLRLDNEDLVDSDFSVFLSFNDLGKIVNDFSWMDLDAIKPLLSEPIVFWQKDSKDFFACLKEFDQIQELENVFVALASKKFPQEKVRYLSDRTKFVELVADPSVFSWLEQDGVKSLVLSGKDTGVHYRDYEGMVLVGSQKENLDPVFCGFDQDYLKIKTSELPQGWFFDYFRNFEILESNGFFWKLK